MVLNKINHQPAIVEPDVKPKVKPSTKPNKDSPWSVPKPKVMPHPKMIEFL